MIRTTINDDSLKPSLMVSAGAHLVLLLVMFFGLPVIFKPLPSHRPPVPFEIVEIAELTNTRIKDPELQVKPPEPPPPKQETKKPEQAQAMPQPKQEEQAEALQTMPKPKPKPPEAAKPKSDEFSKLLKNLETNKKVETPKSEAKSESKQATPATSQAPALSDRLTISEEDALRRQIQQCWNMPIGARDAHNLIVEVIINVNPDRTVQSAEIVDKSRMATDSFYRAAAESALRALYNPRCTPLELPADRYDQWKRINFTFDPRDML
ncbi:MAG: energy transducer TonB [Alphaproteobacteria bacterium]|nr:energy transducer TonB [Alphaproteobacteria bacterium]